MTPPAWSPDGTLIAFRRVTTRVTTADVYVIPALGAEPNGRWWGNCHSGLGVGTVFGNLSWTPDSKWLAYWGESTNSRGSG